MNRRALLSTLAALPAVPALLRAAALAQAQEQAQAQTSQLASWNDGPAKQKIFDFVRSTTDRASPDFVPPEERIATFDQDGTLWVEQPMYSQLMYCFDRLHMLAVRNPALKHTEPFKTALSGNREAIARLTM